MSDGKLVCVARSHGAAPTVRLPDAVHAAANGAARACALRANATLDCFARGARFDFSTSSAPTVKRCEDDGSLSAIKIDTGSEANGAIVHFGLPGAGAERGPRACGDDRSSIRRLGAMLLIGDREVRSAWRVRQTLSDAKAVGLAFTAGGIGPFARPKTIAIREPIAEVAMYGGRACARTKCGRVSCFGCLEL